MKIGLGVIGFAAFIRQEAGKFSPEKVVPRSWLVRYDLPKHMMNKLREFRQPSDVTAEISRTNTYPTQVVPLPKAVFCERQHINSLTNFPTTKLDASYMDFQRRQAQLRESLEAAPHTRTTVKVVPVQSTDNRRIGVKIR